MVIYRKDEFIILKASEGFIVYNIKKVKIKQVT